MRISGVKMAAVGMSRGAAELLSKAVVVNAAAGKHSATLLFLHGLGDTGHGWAEQLTRIRHPSLKIICPNAPVAPVTLNGGFRMPSWFDIYSLDKTSKQDEEGIVKAAKEIHEILDAECSEPGMSPDRIVLGGFSQGGCLAIFSALTYPNRLGGILGLSTYLPIHHLLETKMTSENKTIPFLQCHGDADPMVAYKFGKLSSERITSFNPDNYQFLTYRGLGHASNEQEMEDVKRWLLSVLSIGGNL